ncbi:hypothetical protein HMPREF9237_00537 [Actinotignum schaalii FB123-CNA-2]|uniref:Uncharacterized protein n=1 Tax=Actinotignum schaalii FB123-CNA-2 TaxID=883067 RepID=S2VJ99_9ACTO|nr:hypothetical protein HMPREF9237_00537 [Actinotignum schaalii FB123-CNA-2]
MGQGRASYTKVQRGRVTETKWPVPSQLIVETFVLRETTIVDPGELTAHPATHLVSIASEPREAARCWHHQQRTGKFAGEGWISLELNGQQIMPREAWTHLALFWQSMLDAVEGYLDTGTGRGDFSEETAGFSLTRSGQLLIFELRGQRYPAEPLSFLHGVLRGANQFYRWAHEYVGTVPAANLDYVTQLQARLAALTAARNAR